jgi:hypothetical protein
MFRIAGAVALLLTLMIAPSQAQKGPGGSRWVNLGEKSVGFLVDHDVLRVNQKADWFDREGPFRTLRFTAEGNDIHLTSVRVVYLNGFAENFTANQNLKPRQSLSVDLRGERSYIQQIEFVYRSRLSFKGQATLRIDAESARRGPPGPGPGPGPQVELLGSQKVGFVADRDVLRVGRKEGRFRKIALRAVGNDIEVLDLKVFYTNGAPDDIPVRRVLRAGQRSEPLDLKGAAPRAIDRIEFVYRSRPSFKGQATLEVYGVN